MDNTEIKQKVQGAVDTNYHKELGLVRKMSTIIYNFYGRDHDAREIFPETADELATKLLKEVFNIEVVNPFRDDEYEAVTDETVEDILSKIKAKQSQPKSSLMANIQPPPLVEYIQSLDRSKRTPVKIEIKALNEIDNNPFDNAMSILEKKQ